jgi:phage antirepressor YoqD-like protein
MKLVLVFTDNKITTTSLELVNYINYLRKLESPLDYKELAHYDFLKKVKEVLKGGEGNFSGSYKSAQNKDVLMYIFPEREAMLMAMSYSYDVQAKVYDSWKEAEKMLKGVAEAPLTLPTTYIEALEMLIIKEKEKVVLALELEAASPKIDFVDRYVDKTGSMSLRDGFKSIGKQPNKFTVQLVVDGILYYNQAGEICSKQSHITAEHFKHKITEYGIQVRVTSKGLLYLSKKY